MIPSRWHRTRRVVDKRFGPLQGFGTLLDPCVDVNGKFALRRQKDSASDLVHFGIVIDVNMEVGLCHPPVGLNLYVASMIARMRIIDLAVAVWPWLLTMLVFLVIVTYWPGLALWLPVALGMH
jgi:Tripartite ATP-independent periplasmic transporter, DctM component